MSLIPKKICSFRVRITGGRFKGSIGSAVHRYSDGTFGVDTDKGGRAFAQEGQLERISNDEPFCGAMCSSAYQSDLEHGITYPTIKAGPSEVISHKTYSSISNRCAYCAAVLKEG